MALAINVNTVKSHHGFLLEPLFFCLRLDCETVSQELPEQIPIEIMAKIPDNLSGQLIPTSESRNPHMGTMQIWELHHSSLEPGDMFPFFPLPPRFSFLNGHAWASLVNKIQTCLVMDINMDETWPECYTVLRDIFWMAFVATYPSFPHGEWPKWNLMISMERDFMSYWMNNINNSIRMRVDSPVIF
ncbi:hypothetical protein PAXRUDRAFT_178306 [Paxillus rubicundulus Ve08.2h10]|uniref:Unplaced genomic scaffold scaffold_4868, whole genome shotgun sequence n=1 Tax=Paxillus rubicundulus Ve08.2h10 TaxID=930991 RepID=A0A0D0D107_9AGAM|nr:hypothetical protein PAXRUDRAFT_178306 [Paxillus rubicundulus Ve08.2h10]